MINMFALVRYKRVPKAYVYVAACIVFDNTTVVDTQCHLMVEFKNGILPLTTTTSYSI